MAQIDWTPDMSVGHAEIDRQHQTLLELYNRFDAAAAQGKGRREVDQLLADLFDYTAVHFTAEERDARAARVTPGLERHRTLHRQLLDKLDGVPPGPRAGRRFTTDFRRFLGYWWQNHILEHDREYGRPSSEGIRPTPGPVD